jgi:GNAT superfamily N-acetyltransferase
LSDIYWIKRPTYVSNYQPITYFVPVDKVLENEGHCRDIMDLVGKNFYLRKKFLAVWRAVTFVACYVEKRLDEGDTYKQECDRVAASAFVSGAICWHIDYVVVGEHCRQRGLGRALLARIEQEALLRNIQFLTLISNGSLHDFYKACGFSPMA